MSSRNAKSLSSGHKSFETACNAPCCPRENSKSIRASPCSPTLPLVNGMDNVVLVLQDVCAQLPVEHSHEWNRLSIHLPKTLQHCLEMESYALIPSIDKMDNLGSTLQNACRAWATHSHPTRLKWCRGPLHFRAQLLRHNSSDNPPDNVSSHDATHTASRLLENRDPSQLENVHKRLRDLNCCQRF